MKYTVTFNVLDRRTGRPTPLRLSCEFKDIPRDGAVRAFLQYALEQEIPVGGTPCSVKSVGAPPRTPKVRTPSL
jgi:hypothetical protein